MSKYILHFFKFLKSMILRPKKTLIWIREDLKKDKLGKKEKSSHRVVWCAGLPKSGTTVIEQIFDNLPYVRQNVSFNRLFFTGNLKNDHSISEEMFKYNPSNKYTFLKTHTEYSIYHENIYRKFNLRVIVSLRDLRDMLISRYFHILADENHWLHKKIKDLNFTEGFILSIKLKFYIGEKEKETALNYYYNWINDWLRISKNNEFLVLWFEDFKNNPTKYVNRILDYVDFKNYKSENIIENIKKTEENQKSLIKGLSNYGRLKSTFRKGEVGQWKNLFNNEIENYFYENIPGPFAQIDYKNNLDIL